RPLRRHHRDDLRDARDRADVVDLRWRVVEPLHRWERRPGAWLAAAALERVEESRLLAADVRAGAAVDGHGHVAVEPGLGALVDGGLQGRVLRQVLAAG